LIVTLINQIKDKQVKYLGERKLFALNSGFSFNTKVWITKRAMAKH